MSKTHSPGLSKPRQEEPIHKWPSVEHRGVWSTLVGWDADSYTALRRTLGCYNTWGDHLTAQILWLYNHNLNLPLQYEDDEVLIHKCIIEHLKTMRDGYGWKGQDDPTREAVANTYAEQLAKILGVPA